MARGGPPQVYQQRTKIPSQPSPAVTAKLHQALAFQQQGKLAQAELLYREIIDQAPRNVDAHHLLGVIAYQQGRFDDALASYDKALAIKPDYPEALSNRGNVLVSLKRLDDALANYDKALAIKPNYPEALYNRGNALNAQRRFEDALASYDRALAIKPDYAKAFHNRGNALARLRRFEEALVSYDKALAIKPGYAEALYNRGNALHDLKCFEEALASYEKALALKPDYAEVHWNESLSRLLSGDFERGWQKYEWRWQTEALKNEKRDFSKPLWLGDEDLTGKTVLLHAEQGVGDTIQFCRYAALVSARGGRVVLEVQRPLKSQLATLEGVHQVVARGEPLPAFDFHCPLLSLPLAFKTTLTTIPARIPYIKSAPDLVELWRARLGVNSAPRVGVAWAGNPTHKNDLNRSIALAQLAPLLDLDATLVSLQKDLRPEDQPWLARHREVRHVGGELRDFADTAALLSLMDVVISVDTAIAHLAGAMGRPVWVLLPFIGVDWRWQLDRADSPWYPTARLFRQPKIGDWASAIDAVAREVSGLVRR